MEYLGYTYRRQYYTLWRYATALMLLGVADATGERDSRANNADGTVAENVGSKETEGDPAGYPSRFAGPMHVPQNTLRGTTWI